MANQRKEKIARFVGEAVIQISPGTEAQYEHMTSEGKLVWRLLSLVSPEMREKIAKQLTDNEVQAVSRLLCPGDGKLHSPSEITIEPYVQEEIDRRFPR